MLFSAPKLAGLFVSSRVGVLYSVIDPGMICYIIYIRTRRDGYFCALAHQHAQMDTCNTYCIRNLSQVDVATGINVTEMLLVSHEV